MLIRWTPFLVICITATFVNADDCPDPCVCIGSTVYCNATGITAVPANLPKNTETLYIGMNPIKFVAKTAFVGLTKLQQLDFTGNNFSESSIEKGTLDIPSVTTLDLSNNNYMTIPQDLPPNLVKLIFYYNPINTVRSNSFSNHTSLQTLFLMNTQISKIEDHSFDPLVNAIDIELSFNKLVDGSFSPLSFIKNTKLLNLAFRFNQMTKVPNTTYYPASLQSLDLVGNRIKVIPAYAFRTLANVTSLALWEGAITTLEDNAFYGMVKLSYLDMMQNHVTPYITNDTFNGLPSLQSLYLDLNNITKIEPGAFHSNTNIGVLWLSSNQISTLDPAVIDKRFTPHLGTLYIEDNPWMCDCHLKWLREKVDKEPGIVQDPHLIVCHGPPEVAGKAWDVLKASDFVCKD